MGGEPGKVSLGARSVRAGAWLLSANGGGELEGP